MNQAKELFEIKPLKWEENNAHTWMAGIYSISEEEHGLVLEIDYDHYTNNIDVESIDKGKSIAESHHREQLLKHLTKVESGWLSIESAPMDGSVVMVFDKVLRAARWSKSSNHWFSLVGQQTDPTHWMPLPEPPKL